LKNFIAIQLVETTGHYLKEGHRKHHARASITSNMNRLSSEQRALVLKALVEGNSLRATARMTGVARMTVEKLLRDLSTACIRYQDGLLRNLRCKRVRCNEIWSFAHAKQKNVPDKQEEVSYGDVWTWVAIDANSKLALAWVVGDRSAKSAFALMDDLASRLAYRIQLATDGHRVYLDAVESRFGAGVDYSMLVKIYGANRDNEATYSPGERKRVEDHRQSVALHFMYYNFARIHQTLRVTPAMAAGVTERAWEVEDIVALLSN
jgi:IS1 family transposase